MNKADKIKAFLRVVFSVMLISLIVFIFGNSAQTATASSESSGRVMSFLNMMCAILGLKPFFTQEIVRFLAHFCEFGLLGVLSYITFYFYFFKKLKVSFFASLLVVVVSVTDECLQLFSDGRAFQLSDIVTDLCGAFLGIAVSVFVFFIIERIRRCFNGKCKKIE